MTHLHRMTFCGLRRLNQFKFKEPDALAAWLRNREWHHFTSINIFIGANGSGKSTILELIDLFRDPGRLVNLGRENQTADCLTAFHISFQGGIDVFANIIPNEIKDRPDADNVDRSGSTLDIQSLLIGAYSNGNRRLALEKNISKLELDRASKDTLQSAFDELGIKVDFWTPSILPPAEQLVFELNEARQHLCGVLSENECNDDLPFEVPTAQWGSEHPFQVFDEARVDVFLSDDIRQHNRVHLAALPAGWRQIGAILAWLRSQAPGTVCLLEEPETHLHPHLQRYVARTMARIVEERRLQVFMSTHSSVFQQMTVWPNGATIFQARPERLAKLNSAWAVLDTLGIKGSDISQSNGIIWVEGPSDRVYIKHWIKLYCREYGIREPVENVEYSFSFYGGAALSHFTARETSSFIDMIGINRNCVLIMDQDKDFVIDSQGKLVPARGTSSKRKIILAIETMDVIHCHIWVTDGYTIESYLPDAYRLKYFDEIEGRLVLKENRKKVPIALKYAEKFHHFSSCTDIHERLERHIAKLTNTIVAWNN